MSSFFFCKSYSHFFSKNISVYVIVNVQSFNDTLTNDIVNFEKLGPGLFMHLSFHVQLPTCIIHEQKLHFIHYKSVSLFSMRTVFTQSFEHLNKVSARATMDSKEHRSEIKFLL